MARAMTPAKDDKGPRVHAKGQEKRLDAVIDFVSFAARPRALTSLLDEAPRRLAAVVAAEVCSIYLLEGDGETLVMRGNVGFTDRALGAVRLRLGEGITGAAVSIGRPVSVAAASSHANYRRFHELDEDRFPVFCAVPIAGPRGPLGAVVVQRRPGRPFAVDEVELLVALTTTISAAARQADLVRRLEETPTGAAEKRRAGGGTRKVTLPGRPFHKGRAVGAIAAIKRPPASPRLERRLDDEARLRGAFDVVSKGVRALVETAKSRGVEHASFLQTYLQIASDARLRGETLKLVAGGMGIAEAISRIVRRVTSAATTEGDRFLEERARDVEDLCDALVMTAAADPRAVLPTGAVLIGERLTVFDLLVSLRARPVGIALADGERGGRTETLVELTSVPAIVGVEGLFRWASDGDLALVDADHGLLVINPSRAEVAAVRAHAR